MLQNLSKEIRLCHRRAEDCARQAKAAPTERQRADHLRREQSWLQLACSYELQQRIGLFINEIEKSKDDEHRATAEADTGSPAAETISFKSRGPSRTGNDPKQFRNLIAIVDDDEYARAGLWALVESLGHRAATFASAEDYLASHITESAACLILDVHLPGMSGPDLQAHLIAAGRCPAIVFATGRFEDHVRKRVIEAGALDYLTKPGCEKALSGCIEKVFAQENRRTTEVGFGNTNA